MPDLSQFLGNARSADDIGHTNGYAGAAGGGGSGGLSMEQRRKLLNQPRVVGAYQYSRLGRQGSAVKARTADQKQSRAYDASSNSFSDNATYSSHQRGGKVEGQTQPNEGARREHFIEPPSRGYDKYA